MGKWTDLKGKIFHDVEVIEYLGNSSWKCKCLKCGKIFNRKSSSLKKYGCKCKFINTINENYFDEILYIFDEDNLFLEEGSKKSPFDLNYETLRKCITKCTVKFK